MPKPDNIADLLKTYVKNKDIAKKINHYRLFNYWSAIVGSDISLHAQPKMLRNKVLYISAANPVWSTELGMMSEEIIKKINEFLADEVVKELRIKPNLK
jgi:predicted nucleic acid-binding Zn ribbon protein